jgi:hypothetical protein
MFLVCSVRGSQNFEKNLFSAPVNLPTCVGRVSFSDVTPVGP